MKSLQLGINYGMGVPSLSRGLGRHLCIGSEVIIRHQRRHPDFWTMARGRVQRAMLERVIVSDSTAGRYTSALTQRAHVVQFSYAERRR